MKNKSNLNEQVKKLIQVQYTIRRTRNSKPATNFKAKTNIKIINNFKANIINITI